MIHQEMNGINANCNDRPQPQKRSFFNKFEVEYMNPIFGGPDPVRLIMLKQIILRRIFVDYS